MKKSTEGERALMCDARGKPGWLACGYRCILVREIKYFEGVDQLF